MIASIISLSAATVGGPSRNTGDDVPETTLPKVYFTREISSDALMAVYEALGREATGKVAVKISTGEPGNNNYLAPALIEGLVRRVGGTIVECNTAYGGGRAETEAHLKAAEEHDFTLVLSHFKGHPMGGFGGALKNIAIGIASSQGKAWIHSAGKTKSVAEVWNDLPPQDDFLESMAEAAKAITDHCGERILYISVANNLSVDCDCVAAPEDPKMGDIGILASLDPVALDKACVDMVRASEDHGKIHLIERIDSRHGTHILDYAEQLGMGSRKYELVDLDK